MKSVIRNSGYEFGAGKVTFLRNFGSFEEELAVVSGGSPRQDVGSDRPNEAAVRERVIRRAERDGSR